MTHCSLGTDKDMETRKRNQPRHTTNKRHTHTTSFLLASIPLLFLFFVMQRPPSTTEKQVHLHCRAAHDFTDAIH